MGVPQPRNPARYHILNEHGRGGLGKVSRAHDLELGRDIAIKELLSRNPMHEVRFMREALITARLEHPGIVPVHEAGRWPDGTPFYAMKLVGGRPLRDLLAERKTVDERVALLHHVIAVADAIAYAHGRNIIHRDLKPSNVIVGDFGETVVIDWGLAKDLSGSEGSTSSTSPVYTGRDDDLTSAGAVLGTPAYMAPEQRHGARVDQRADVYAIGAMLWELCSLEKLPHSDGWQRRRLLRSAGIASDLIAIIDNALAAAPDHRYPDAGALAADLKAFKAGTRIGVRNYSFWALLAHWRRRHSKLASTILGAFALVLATTLVYVHNITLERDRADKSELNATHARAIAESSLGELTLKHAEVLLQSDPTATMSILEGYHGLDNTRYAQLRAEALGYGIAKQVLRPHFDTIYFLAAQPDGSIISISEDGRVRRTINKETTTLASDVAHVSLFAYSSSSTLLAYATPQQQVTVLNIQTGTKQNIEVHSPKSLSFSSDGARLAILDTHGEIKLWSAASKQAVALYRDLFVHAQKIAFTAQDQLLILGASRLQLISPEGHYLASLAIDSSAVDFSKEVVAVGSRRGDLFLLTPALQIAVSLSACRDAVTTVKLISHSRSIAFGCAEGGVGFANFNSNAKTLTKISSFETSAQVSEMAVDESGEHILASSESDAYLHYTRKHLTHRLRGQGARISAIATATPNFPYFLTGDIHGSLRIWEPSAPPAHTVAHVEGIPYGARFSPDGRTVAVYGSETMIQAIRLTDGSVTQFRGHAGAIRGLCYSSSGDLLMSYSWDGTARIWNTQGKGVSAIFSEHRSLVQRGYFADADRHAVTAGDDGHVFLWDVRTGTGTPIFTHSASILELQPLATKQRLLAQDSAGSLWELDHHGKVEPVRTPHASEVTITRVSSDGRLAAIGQHSGLITVYRTSDWQTVNTLTTRGSIGGIVWHPNSASFVALSEDGIVTIMDAESSPPTSGWPTLQTRAHNIAYSPDGSLIAITTHEGGTWFYSPQQMLWSYVHDHSTEVRWGGFHPKEATFLSIDRTGTVVARDVSQLSDSWIK